MVKLKNKIVEIDSLPNYKKKKISFTKILFYIILLLIFLTILYFSYIKLLPYINATDINKITGKKINITECNTKDYIIINKDKTYSMNLTNSNCISNYYEGTIIIKNNEIIFTKEIKGLINSDNNIIIDNKIFKSDNNE